MRQKTVAFAKYANCASFVRENLQEKLFVFTFAYQNLYSLYQL